MSNKLIFSLMSKKWHADGGDIYFNKHLSAINNEIPLLYLNNEMDSLPEKNYRL